jgi:hypothetical protein
VDDLSVKSGILNLGFEAWVYLRILPKAKAKLQLLGLGARNPQSDTGVIGDMNTSDPNDRIEPLARGELSCKLSVVALFPPLDQRR